MKEENGIYCLSQWETWGISVPAKKILPGYVHIILLTNISPSSCQHQCHNSLSCAGKLESGAFPRISSDVNWNIWKVFTCISPPDLIPVWLATVPSDNYFATFHHVFQKSEGHVYISRVFLMWWIPQGDKKLNFPWSTHIH